MVYHMEYKGKAGENLEMKRMDLHVYTTFSDGKNTPKEVVLSAIEKCLKTIGFLTIPIPLLTSAIVYTQGNIPDIFGKFAD